MTLDDGQFIEKWLLYGTGTLVEQLVGLLAGDTRELVILANVPALFSSAARTLTKAWFTVKRTETGADATVNAAWTASGGSQSITSANVAGRGQILTTSSGSSYAQLRFDLTAANTIGLLPHLDYHADVQIQTSDGALYTVERIIFQVRQGVTLATS